jgi:hypothetical protein
VAQVDGSVLAVAPDGAGGWYIGGRFTSVGGVPRSRLARITASGVLDTTFQSGPSTDGPLSAVHALAVSGSTVYAGGSFASISQCLALAASGGAVYAVGAWANDGSASQFQGLHVFEP